MAFIKRVRDKKWLGTTSALFLVFLAISVGCTCYYVTETSHYVYTSCQLTNGTITSNERQCYSEYTYMLRTSGSYYACFDGSVDYYPVNLNQSYSVHYDFRYYDSDTDPAFLENGTISCSYDDRDIQKSMKRDSQPSLTEIFGIIVFSAMVACVSLSIVLVRSSTIRRRSKSYHTQAWRMRLG